MQVWSAKGGSWTRGRNAGNIRVWVTFKVMRTVELREEKVKAKEEGTEPHPGSEAAQCSGRERGASRDGGGEAGVEGNQGGEAPWKPRQDSVSRSSD